MGQKVSPIGLRVGINKDWESKWYAPKKDFSKKLNEDIKIREYIEKNLNDKGIAKVEIEKVKKELSKLTGTNVFVSIVDIKKPDLNAKLVADSIAKQISNRASFRMAQKRAIKNAMKAGAKGIKTSVSGRLGGADMARSEGYTEGTIPLHTIRADVDYANSEADTTFGKIGVKVWIYKGEILPTKQNKGGK